MYTQNTQRYFKTSQSNFMLNIIVIITGSLFLFAGFLMSLFFLTVTITLIPVIAVRVWWSRRFAQEKNSVHTCSTGNIIDAEYTEVDK